MRELVARYLSHSISRRSFLKGMTTAGVSLVAAKEILESLVPVAHAQGIEGVKIVEGTGGLCFAEQLIASGVKYVFGNSASEDAHFYEALVDRPQLKYILTPHEGPGAAMAAGYVKASGEPTIVMQAAAVGLMNAMGQMFNAYKEQTPLVFYSYRTDQTGRAGRDGFEEVANQEQLVQPLTKYSWLARKADMIPETIRRAFKAAWTPPYGPTYASWHSDLNDERVKTEVILQSKVDPRMRVRPNPAEVERAAKLLVEAKMPLMIVGDEIYGAKATAKAVKLAELLGMPVTQARQMFVNFPEAHPLWVGSPPVSRLASLDYPKNPDVVINVGNKLQHNSPQPIVGRGAKFIDLRIDSASMGNVMLTEVPLVADVAHGLDDLTAAVQQLINNSFKEKAAARSREVKAFHDKAGTLRNLVLKNPDWNRAPMLADRVTREVAQFADKDAIIVHEAGSVVLHGFDFNPDGGRDLFFYYGAHLGSGVGTAAGVKLARPNRQVICLVGDGSFIFGPTALWNMARLELPVITVVYNNHAYSGPHSRVIEKVPGGRMIETGHFFHDYLGNPDMNMALIAKGFGVDGEVANSPEELRAALGRARKAAAGGKPYLIDAQVARVGVAWADKPWTPTIRG
ncbi:MAG: acetolactate synthase large subunit [Betaproteobacteria bacterium]|jgi:thiamine pyrophosphate-dependent acetolactate synthase large subunit-like protein|nr:acetolactate synthase large subunit [Betaproteobacteria bacterium]